MENIELILTDKIYTINEIEHMSKDVFKGYGIKKAYVFGSYAKNQAKSDSDIDIMIKKDDSFSFLQLSAMANELMIIFKKEIDIITEETYTEDIQYDDEDKKRLKERFFHKVRKEMIKIYG